MSDVIETPTRKRILQIGKRYFLKLVRPWNELEYDIEVNSIVNIDTLDSVGNFDIRGEFFTPYNLGLSTYVDFIKKETNLYVCKTISSLEPIAIDDNIIIIPEPCLDPERIVELIPITYTDITIVGAFKNHRNILEENAFIQKILTDINRKINELQQYIGRTVEIENVQRDALIRETEYEELQKHQQTLYEERIASENNINQIKRHELEVLYSIRDEYESAKNALNTAIADFKRQITPTP